MKKVLITGGNGFLGKHISKLFMSNNYEVFCPSSKEYNLTKEKEVEKLFRENPNYHILIHAAADIGGIGYSSRNSSKQFYNNILMNTFILHYASMNNVNKFVGLGSVCSYPALTAVPFNENKIWDGYPVETNDAYGFTKRMLLAQGIFYKRDYDFSSIHLVPVNLYGPGDDFSLKNSHVIPALIRKIHLAKINKEKTVNVWGTGEESREFLYVEDAAKAIFMATEKYNKMEPVNIGSGIEIKIKDLCILIARLMNFNANFVFSNNGLGGQQRRKLDVSKAKKEFGFYAETSLSDGLLKTISYFYENLDDIISKDQ